MVVEAVLMWGGVRVHHPTPGFSLALFLSLAEAGCNQHQEPIP